MLLFKSSSLGKLRKLKQDMGIDSYLTGLSGGVRYAPVVRYSKVHLYMAPEDIQEARRIREETTDDLSNMETALYCFGCGFLFPRSDR